MKHDLNPINKMLDTTTLLLTAFFKQYKIHNKKDGSLKITAILDKDLFENNLFYARTKITERLISNGFVDIRGKSSKFDIVVHTQLN